MVHTDEFSSTPKVQRKYFKPSQSIHQLHLTDLAVRSHSANFYFRVAAYFRVSLDLDLRACLKEKHRRTDEFHHVNCDPFQNKCSIALLFVTWK